MIRPVTRAICLTAALGLAGAPVAAQSPGPRAPNAPAGIERGPHGSAVAPIQPQLRTIESALRNAAEQLGRTGQDAPAPNYAQARRAVMGGEDTLAEMRSVREDQTVAMQKARQALAEARQALEGENIDRARAAEEVQQAAAAIGALVNGATGADIGGGQPATGGGARR